MDDDGILPDARRPSLNKLDRSPRIGFVAMPARIMVVIQGRLLRDCIQRILESPSRIFVGSCEALEDVEAAIGPLSPPDLFIVELGEAKQNAAMFTEIRGLKSRMPASRWVVLSRPGDQQFLRTAAELGVDAILLENSCFQALQLVTELVLLGHSCLPAEAFRAMEEPDAPAGGRTVAPIRAETDLIRQAPLPAGNAIGSGARLAIGGEAIGEDRLQPRKSRLSDREKQILTCLVAGHSNKLIGRELGIAETTVKVHVKALLRKMQVANRTQAAICALQFLGAPGGHA